MLEDGVALRIPGPVDHHSELPPIIVPMIGEFDNWHTGGGQHALEKKQETQPRPGKLVPTLVIDFGSER